MHRLFLTWSVTARRLTALPFACLLSVCLLFGVGIGHPITTGAGASVAGGAQGDESGVTVSLRRSESITLPAGKGRGGVPCRAWSNLYIFEIMPLAGLANPFPIEGPPGEKYHMLHCPAPNLPISVYTIWLQSDPPPRPVIDWLIEQAVARAEAPVPVVASSPPGTPERPYLTGLGTWWWIDDAHWQPVRATARFPGADTPAITALLQPQSSAWTLDGEQIACAQGVAWTPADGADTDRAGYCGLTPRRVSPAGGSPLDIAVSYRVSLACEPAVMCRGLQPPGPVIRHHTEPVHITQIRPVLVGPP